MEKTTKEQNPSVGNQDKWTAIINESPLVLQQLQQRSLKEVLNLVAGRNTKATDKNIVEQVGEALGIPGSIQVEKTVTIQKPAAELYDYWHNFTNLPNFMKHLKAVTVQGQRSHWVAAAPLDQRVEWDAETILDQENHLIAWTSVGDAVVENSGFVRFMPAVGDRGTQVKVVMEYNPPGGVVGAAIAKLFGEEPSQQIGDELNRFKQLMEAGEIATTEGQPKGS